MNETEYKNTRHVLGEDGQRGASSDRAFKMGAA